MEPLVKLLEEFPFVLYLTRFILFCLLFHMFTHPVLLLESLPLILLIITPILTHPTPIVLFLLSLFPFLYPLFTCFVVLLAQHSCIVLHR